MLPLCMIPAQATNNPTILIYLFLCVVKTNPHFFFLIDSILNGTGQLYVFVINVMVIQNKKVLMLCSKLITVNVKRNYTIHYCC